jgi:hypothetical protein
MTQLQNLHGDAVHATCLSTARHDAATWWNPTHTSSDQQNYPYRGLHDSYSPYIISKVTESKVILRFPGRRNTIPPVVQPIVTKALGGYVKPTERIIADDVPVLYTESYNHWSTDEH